MKSNCKRRKVILILVSSALFVIAGCSIENSPDPEENNFTWQLDGNFADSGVLLNDINDLSVDNYLNSLAVDGDGKILITGSGPFYGGGYVMYLGRYNSDGTLDEDFAVNGFFIESVDSIGRYVALDASGRIVVSGRRTNGSNTDMAVWRFLSDGSPDSSFDGDGVAVFDISASNDDSYDLAFDSSGNMYVGGFFFSGSNNDTAIWKVTSAGVLDTAGFNPPFGYVTHDSAAGGSSNDYIQSLCLDSSGNIYVSGSSYNISSNSDMAVYKYNSTGTLDSSFGGDGIVIFDSGQVDDSQDLLVDQDGRILVTGGSTGIGSTTSRNMLILAYKTDGSPDESFGVNGSVHYDHPSGGDLAYSIMQDQDGNIFSAGLFLGSTQDMAVWMFDQDGNPVDSFGTNGVFVIDQTGDSDSAICIAPVQQGQIIVGGQVENNGKLDIALWKLSLQ